MVRRGSQADTWKVVVISHHQDVWSTAGDSGKVLELFCLHLTQTEREAKTALELSSQALLLGVMTNTHNPGSLGG